MFCHIQIQKKQCSRVIKKYGANIYWFLTKNFLTFPYDLLSLDCTYLIYKCHFFFTHFDGTFLSLEVLHNGVKYFLKEFFFFWAFSRVIIVRFKSCEIAVAWRLKKEWSFRNWFSPLCTKGQLISKGLFGILNSSKKNERKQFYLRYHCTDRSKFSIF